MEAQAALRTRPAMEESIGRDDGLDRTLGWVICTGGLLFFMAKVSGIGKQWTSFPLWWHALGFAALALLTAALIVGQMLQLRWLRWMWVLVVVLVLVAQATSFAAFRGVNRDTVVPWIWDIEPGAVTLMVLLTRPILAVAYAALSGVSPLLSGIAFGGQIPREVAVQTPVHVSNFAFVVIFVGIRLAMVNVRRAEALARTQADEEVRSRALEVENDEMARVLHDEVLGTLIAASRMPGSPPDELRAAATRSRGVLRRISAAADSTRESGTVTTGTVDERLTARVAELAPDARIDLHRTDGSVPSAVAGAIVHAAAEAARNSTGHAGAHAERSVTGWIGPEQINVEVADTGRAFDLQSVDTRRLGIRLSIQGRMRAVGGSADIRSDAAGTVVTLRWTRDQLGDR